MGNLPRIPGPAIQDYSCPPVRESFSAALNCSAWLGGPALLCGYFTFTMKFSKRNCISCECCWCCAGLTGLEPAACGFGDRCSNHLSYIPIPVSRRRRFVLVSRFGQQKTASVWTYPKRFWTALQSKFRSYFGACGGPSSADPVHRTRSGGGSPASQPRTDWWAGRNRGRLWPKCFSSKMMLTSECPFLICAGP